METGWRWAELRRPFTGVEASKQAAGMEGVAGSSGQVRGRLTVRAGRPPDWAVAGVSPPGDDTPSTGGG